MMMNELGALRPLSVYILAYFLTKFKFIFLYFHCKNLIILSISIPSSPVNTLIGCKH